MEKLKYHENKRSWWRQIFMPLSKEKKENKDNSSILDTISIDEWILIILYAQKEKPITGKLMFVKQAFLLAQDVFPLIKNKFEFYPASFGPYSKNFAKAVNELIKGGSISLETKEEGDNIIFRFRLSEKGEEIAKEAFEKLTEKEQNIIKRKRKGWDQLGYRGIVRFVYTKYPEYAVLSKIKEGII